MPQTQIACPRCKQPITANVEQLFDVSADPAAKQRLLGGISNMARCPHCGGPVVDAYGVTCRFCGQALRQGEADWIVSGIEPAALSVSVDGTPRAGTAS